MYNDNQYEFDLQDRISKIQAIDKQYDLQHNSYIAFSGGKDSCVLSKLIDLALPGNNIPRVFSNTGIEYSAMVKFVKNLSLTDKRIIILNQDKNIKKTLNTYGYPFKSKEHSKRVKEFNNSKKLMPEYIKYYVTGINGNGEKGFNPCPNILKYQFDEKGKYNYSDLCCTKLKKSLQANWQMNSNRNIILTGMRKSEGGQRMSIKCTVFDEGKLKKFHPLAVVSEDFEHFLIERERVELCELYYPPYNFKRTGCKGCPFNRDIEKDLDTLYRLLPNEYKQCIYLWKPIYDEYIRIGYRLKDYPHLKPKNKKLF